MRERIKACLREITGDTRLEASWLNTISLLEYTGARKISRTVADGHPSAVVLDHLADETRHAYAFKKLAVELVGGEPGEYLCEEAAKRYFFKLDRELSAWVTDLVGEENMFLNYLVVTTMIERRAMEMYPLYRAASEHESVRDELSKIIKEEQSHRVAIEERCIALLSEHGVKDLSAPLAVEQAYFAEFWATLEDTLGNTEAAAE